MRQFDLIRAWRARAGALALGALLVFAAFAPARASEAHVPYVPTPQNVVERMLEIAKVGPQDYLIDLGSGDGRIVVTAARKHGARGFGVDLNPTRVAEAQENARRAGVADRVAFYQRDLFETDLSAATVITMYLLSSVNLELRPKLLDLKPGTRIVSHDFAMGEWRPDVHEQLAVRLKHGGVGGTSDIYLWIVPAKVGGTWQAQLELRGKPVRYEIALEQRFQTLSGTVRTGGRKVKLTRARVDGESVAFEFTAHVGGAPVKHVFSGTAQGDLLGGTAELSGGKVQGKVEWTAERS